MTAPPEAPRGSDEEEERAVLDEVARLREEIPPGDPSAAGCLVAMVALIAFVFMPVASRALPLSSGTLVILGGILLAIAATGAVVGVFGGRSARTRSVREVERSVEAVVEAARAGDESAERRAAVRLLTRATRSAGPVRVAQFDRDAVAERLGDALAYVRRVERLLVDVGEIDPVFTADRSPGS